MADQTDQTPVEHPISVQAFVTTLKGTDDEVYGKLLMIEHRFQNKTPSDWRASLHGHRGLPPETSAAEAKPVVVESKPDDETEEHV